MSPTAAATQSPTALADAAAQLPTPSLALLGRAPHVVVDPTPPPPMPIAPRSDCEVLSPPYRAEGHRGVLPRMGAGTADCWGSSRARIPQDLAPVTLRHLLAPAPPQLRTLSWVWGDPPSSGAENAADSRPVLLTWS
ncbi:unnamed protein product [Rangifer tarandus platyrhynchus]|uniref:Uncharacterized protein n=1 Tax=Rangifer tarandus platyrhynchus TaxID=3082113 RepID=A0ABN8Y7A2_RANTA|nr:unnamed protein product [Rangifer tarandus platyrhynchus]